MPAATSISANDSGAVAHVFVPVSVTPQLSLFRNTATAAMSASEENIGLSLSRASANRPTNKVKITINIPHESLAPNGIDYVVRDTFRFVGEWVIPDLMSTAERNDAETIVRNVLNVTALKNYIKDLEAYW